LHVQVFKQVIPGPNAPYSTSTDLQFRKLSLSDRVRNIDRPTIASVEEWG